MDMLHSLWPMVFKIQKGDVGSFIVRLILFTVVCAVVGWIISLLSGIFLIGIIFSLLGGLLEIYSVVGVVLCILVFVGVIS